MKVLGHVHVAGVRAMRHFSGRHLREARSGDRRRNIGFCAKAAYRREPRPNV
jgi:hypothetical protein